MPYRLYRIEMKATLVSMAIALVAIVALSFYLHGGSLPPHPASAPHPQPFSLASDPSDPLLIQSPLLQEPFQAQPSVVSVSDTAYNAMTAKQRTDFLHQVQQVIRGEILASRQLEHPEHEHEHEQSCDSGTDDNRNKPEAGCDSETSLSECHGREYQKQQGKQEKQEQSNKYRCPKNPDGSCPPFPDMTQYIRKDQIPCWGCSVDF